MSAWLKSRPVKRRREPASLAAAQARQSPKQNEEGCRPLPNLSHEERAAPWWSSPKFRFQAPLKGRVSGCTTREQESGAPPLGRFADGLSLGFTGEPGDWFPALAAVLELQARRETNSWVAGRAPGRGDEMRCSFFAYTELTRFRGLSHFRGNKYVDTFADAIDFRGRGRLCAAYR